MTQHVIVENQIHRCSMTQWSSYTLIQRSRKPLNHVDHYLGDPTLGALVAVLSKAVMSNRSTGDVLHQPTIGGGRTILPEKTAHSAEQEMKQAEATSE